MTLTSIHDSVQERIGVSAFSIDGWSVAPEGYTGRSCPSCSSYFTSVEIDAMYAAIGSYTGAIKCLHCGAKSTSETANIGVKQDSVALFDEDVARDTIWYHATLMDSWHKKILSASRVSLVHLGTKDAALDRAKHISEYMNGTGTWTVYSVKIDKDALIAPLVLDDEDEDAPSTEENSRSFRARGYEVRGVTRYVNRFEAEGSISLLANPRSFCVIGKELQK